MQSFDELPIAPLLKENLKRARLAIPMPIQARAVPVALEGKDVLGTAQTGTGKTVAFALPILEKLVHSGGHGIEALVLVPTRELAIQVMETFARIGKGSGIRAVEIVGGFAESRQLESIRQGARLAVATPGRLDDYIKRRLVNLSGVKTLVLDEADRMVDMGFLPQMRSIMNAVPRERQTMGFSATLEPPVARLVHEYLKNPARAEIGSTTKPIERVKLQVYEVSRERKVSLLVHMLTSEAGTFLVFTRTKYGADKLARKLQRAGFDAAVIHGGRSQSQRTAALHGFKQGKHRVLVATDIAARGIHVHGIAHVVNYDLPQAPEDFIHRVGRTGRVEARGVATTFVMPEDLRDMRLIERLLEARVERLPLPQGLAQEPRSLHDEYAEGKARLLGSGFASRSGPPARRNPRLRRRKFGYR
ncbi:MAG: DEAD/DEAH box helicase [Candidatus Sungbacteria bacterium]|uniref:DEAD/DEAH box helicase n=1 Tax=Candidatus Sungiibacteriota bacterium TaxID=2750080 RepID=A0A931WPI9_9BACT|nr:DEAD/DEAH box helicase [Candidatus Sungbacteria bacterium]